MERKQRNYYYYFIFFWVGRMQEKEIEKGMTSQRLWLFCAVFSVFLVQVRDTFYLIKIAWTTITSLGVMYSRFYKRSDIPRQRRKIRLSTVNGD